VPFLQCDAEIRWIVCTTNAIESVNARIRRVVWARGHFPAENAALKCCYLAVMSLDPTGTGRKRWTSRWKRTLQAFDIAFNGRAVSLGYRALGTRSPAYGRQNRRWTLDTHRLGRGSLVSLANRRRSRSRF
jgi:Transposase, Mutator family